MSRSEPPLKVMAGKFTVTHTEPPLSLPAADWGTAEAGTGTDIVDKQVNKNPGSWPGFLLR